MLRSEIKTLRDELREKKPPWRTGDCQLADRLTAILDADPVAKLEAMGLTGIRDDNLAVLISPATLHEEPILQHEGGRVSVDIHGAAERLLARITEAP